MNPEKQQETYEDDKALGAVASKETGATEPDMVPQAQQPALPATPVASMDPLDFVPPTPTTPTLASPPIQPVNIDQSKPSDHKKIKILGYSVIILTVLSAITSIVLNFVYLKSSVPLQLDSSLVMPILYVLVGVGILKYKKIALYAFVIIHALGLLLFIGMSILVPWLLMILPFFLVYAAYVLWGFYVLLPRRVRALFH